MSPPIRSRPSPPDPIQVAKSQSDLAVVTDQGGRVVYWNDAAAELFGKPSSAVAGQPFPEVVDGRDVFSNRMFHDSDRFRRIVERGEPVRSFAFDVKSRSGEATRVAANVLVVWGPQRSRWRLVYQLRPTRCRRRTDIVLGHLDPPSSDRSRSEDSQPADVGAGHSGLTRRQLQVLERIAEGQSSREISESLGIAVNTVRTHTQALLERLGVHTRAEAVAVAFRHGLI